MNKMGYFNYIEEKFNLLCTRIERRGKINLLDLNIHSENFFADLFNMVFNLNFVNANEINQNIDGIDLIDNTNKVVAQVSATCNKAKIEQSLSRERIKEYKEYNYIFISIAKDASTKLKKQEFNNPHMINFDSNKNIWDPTSLLRKMQNKSTLELRELYDFFQYELGEQREYVKVETNLAHIVEVLSKENLSTDLQSPGLNEYAIEEKIEHNNLMSIKKIIDDYKIYYSKLDGIYSEFDSNAKNASFSVLQNIGREYQKLKDKGLSSREIFFEIIEKLITKVRMSSNYIELPFEELQLCIDIIVVDAFIRCKIFENPGGYKDVITR